MHIAILDAGDDPVGDIPGLRMFEITPPPRRLGSTRLSPPLNSYLIQADPFALLCGWVVLGSDEIIE
jgi:hypothetical protein